MDKHPIQQGGGGGGRGSNTPNCFMLQKPVRSGSVHWPLRLLVWLEQLSEFAEFQDTEELSNDASFSIVYFLFIFRENTIFQQFCSPLVCSFDVDGIQDKDSYSNCFNAHRSCFEQFYDAHV